VADRGQPPEPLAPEVGDLGLAEYAHGVLLLASRSKLVKDHAAVRMARLLPAKAPGRIREEVKLNAV
jgi:hypothetical protein